MKFNVVTLGNRARKFLLGGAFIIGASNALAVPINLETDFFLFDDIGFGPVGAFGPDGTSYAFAESQNTAVGIVGLLNDPAFPDPPLFGLLPDPPTEDIFLTFDYGFDRGLNEADSFTLTIFDALGFDAMDFDLVSTVLDVSVEINLTTLAASFGGGIPLQGLGFQYLFQNATGTLSSFSLSNVQIGGAAQPDPSIPVPEPSTVGLLLTGLLVLVTFRRRCMSGPVAR